MLAMAFIRGVSREIGRLEAAAQQHSCRLLYEKITVKVPKQMTQHLLNWATEVVTKNEKGTIQGKKGGTNEERPHRV